MDRDRNRRGQVLVLTVSALLVVLAVSVFAIDVGYMFHIEARAQNASDAAVLAAVQVLVHERNAGEDEDDARTAASNEAEAIALGNCPQAAVDIQFGRFKKDSSFEEFDDDDEDDDATAVRAVVARNSEAPGGPLDLFFGPVLGMHTAEVSAQATSAIDKNISGVRANLAPFAVYEGSLCAPGGTMTIYDHETRAPGAFGLLNFDGGSFGTPEAKGWIEDGYDKEFKLKDTGYRWVNGGTGFRAALKNSIDGRLGQKMTVCVYDDIQGGGHGTEFRVMSFARVTLIDSRLTGNNKYVTARLEKLTNLHELITGNAGDAPNLCKLRLRH